MTVATMPPEVVAQVVDMADRMVAFAHHMLAVVLPGCAQATHAPPPSASLNVETLPPIRAQAPRTARPLTPAERTARWRAKQRTLALGDTVTARVTRDVTGDVTPSHRDVTSRAVFSSSKETKEKKNNSLELDTRESVTSPRDVTGDVTVTVTPPRDVTRGQVLTAEDITPFLEAYAQARGATMAVNEKEKAALKLVIYGPQYANGDKQEALRRWRIGLSNYFPATHSFQALARPECWNGLTQPQAPPGAKPRAAPPPVDDTPCAVPGCDRGTEGKRIGKTPLCYRHIAQAMAADLATDTDVAAWARAQGVSA